MLWHAFLFLGLRFFLFSSFCLVASTAFSYTKFIELEMHTHLISIWLHAVVSQHYCNKKFLCYSIVLDGASHLIFHGWWHNSPKNRPWTDVYR
jgi:hypothetical protein